MSAVNTARVERQDPERFKRLLEIAQRENTNRFAVYKQLAALRFPDESTLVT